MTSTNEAARFLDYYLDASVESEYAVMLSAPWGAGKTHFIKIYLDARAAGLPPKEQPGYLYASLYGVASVGAIHDQFFAQAHPHLSSKASRIIGSALSGAIEKLGGMKGTDQLARDMLLKLDGNILVIDDLERCSMKVPDILGFINSFVEHEKLKVIILANEEEISGKEDYERQKEKLVGKTIQVKADPSEVLDKLTARLRTHLVREVVTHERTALLATFNGSTHPNYRNLRAILEDFERLVEAVDVRLRDQPEAMKQLLLYMIATGGESRSGTLDREALRLLRTSQFSTGLLSNKERSPADKQFDQLKSRYPEVKWTDPIVSPGHLSELFFTGKIDADKINESLARHPEVAGHVDIPAWRLLWDWTRLPKGEYETAKTALLSQLDQRSIIYPELILHAAGIIISLRQFGDPVLGEDCSAEQYFSDYASCLLNSNTLLAETGAFGLGGTGALGLGYSSSDTPEFQAIYSMMKKATDEVFHRQMQTVAGGYVERLAASTDNYSSLYEYGVQDGNYAATPFLQFIDVKDFAKLLIIDSCSNEQLFASLIKRYEHDHMSRKALADEYDWTDSLKAELLRIISTETAPFAELLKLRLDYYFGKIGEGIGRPTAEP
ncbi:P-loop NTPase fold protein [Pseudomonas sp. ok266]|uniref:P-loop NTPase fold protein n=1 Tax=Pseudomonas sp. ok266 TaxID=1761896 RepID=UPI0008CD71CE|nr:P-loop NTPase fold protein [Pseudomonas sp. ok266]SEP32445.1 KAP family P-loop domain-containing protein [Pseudomonas sp. ok266]